MSPTRREFIKSLGIALASLTLSRCAPFTTSDGSTRERLRNCWLRLDWLAKKSQKGRQQGNQAHDELIADHQRTLGELVSAGELDEVVAGQVEIAFAAAASHVRDLNVRLAETESPMPTCYEAVVIMATPTLNEAAESSVKALVGGSATRLTQQIELLTEVAESSDLEPDTVTRAQAAIEREITLLTLSPQGAEALRDQFLEASGGTYDLPYLDKIDPEIPPEAAKAAQFLVELLLEE